MELTPLLVYAIGPILGIVLYIIHSNLTYWKRRGIPSTEPHPFWGNMIGWRKTKIIQEIFVEAYNKHKGSGPFCGLYIFQRPSALVLDKTLVKNVLVKDFANFADKGLFFNERDDPLSGHLFVLDGVNWKNLRQKLSPTFTAGKMKFMFPTLVRVAEEFIEVFGKMVQKSANVEIKEMMSRFTTDVIGTCAFGIDCNSLKDPNAEFLVMGRMALTKARHGNIIISLLHSYPILARRLRMRQIHDDIHNFFLRTVRDTLDFRERNKIKRNDFMDLLIELKNQKDGDGLGGLTVEQVAAQAFVFFLAGFETSSSTMCFALYELARHPEWQDKLRAEVNVVFEKYNQKFTYESMSELYLMQQVISETLRLYTINPIIQRQALNDYVVPGHPKYVIEKGIAVLIPIAAFHLDPEYYPDPHAFKPERFSPEMVQQRDSVEWFPFGIGPRNCIGIRFSRMQVLIGLAFLLKNFKFSFNKETQVPLIYDVKQYFLNTKEGIVLKVEKI